jgi:hypothetical protein
VKTLAEAKLIARTSDPDWVGEELFRLQERAAAAESGLREAVTAIHGLVLNECTGDADAAARHPEWKLAERLQKIADGKKA